MATSARWGTGTVVDEFYRMLGREGGLWGCFSIKYSAAVLEGAVKDEKWYPVASCITAIVMLIYQQLLVVDVS